MSYLKSEITGTANTLAIAARRLEIAINEGWEEQDTMLTPRHVEQVKRAIAETKRTLAKAQESFKRFEGVADARKVTVDGV